MNVGVTRLYRSGGWEWVPDADWQDKPDRWLIDRWGVRWGKLWLVASPEYGFPEHFGLVAIDRDCLYLATWCTVEGRSVPFVRAWFKGRDAYAWFLTRVLYRRLRLIAPRPERRGCLFEWKHDFRPLRFLRGEGW